MTPYPTADDPLAPARGCINGMLTGALFFIAIILLVLAGCNDDPPPLTRQEIDAAVQQFHQALCPAPPRDGIPGGALADGSCGE